MKCKKTFLAALAAAAAAGCANMQAPGTANMQAPGAGAAQADFRDTIMVARDAVFPALAYIRVVCRDFGSGKDEKGVVSGSGVVISPDGELLTNHHVIDKAEEIRCLLSGGDSYAAEVVGFDQDLDVALLRLVRPEGAPPLPFAKLSPDTLRIGDVVLAMGAPWGLARSVTMGIVSCTDRYLEGAGRYTLWYQTDAAISPGNSGGPLVDTSGRVVGINARGMTFGDQAFTIPSPTVLEILPSLRETGTAGWSWFGFRLQPLRDFDRNIEFDAAEGVVVAGTDPASPARKAGFKAGDRVTAVDGEAVTAGTWEEMPAIERALGRVPPGRDTRFTVVRGGETLEIAVAPRAKGAVEGGEKVLPRWGFTAKEINRFDNPQLAFYAPDGGVFVSATAWDGNAEASGLKENDIVREAGGKPIATLDDLAAVYDEAMERIAETTKISMVVERRGRKVPIKLNYFDDPEKEIIE
ncbi:MAG: trypsin-like peptidase domain-containing protein [Kiritimatiellae bacterium]|nr:trypsin-like peptidase domain-containing protein [Kiritimatiellia bacterium]